MKKEEETIGGRIAMIRGDLKQIEFAEKTGVGRTTLIRYEAGTTSPDAKFLLRVIELFGVDPVWLLVGGDMPHQPNLTTDEQLLLERYRTASQSGKDAILGAALGQGGGIGQQFNAPIHQMAGRDIRNKKD